MIPAFLIARFGKFGAYLAVAAAIALVVGIAYWRFWAWVEGREEAAKQAIIAEMKAKTDAEHERRIEVLEKAQVAAQQAAAAVAQTERAIASHIAKIDQLSRAHDRDRCLGVDATRRLRAIGRQDRREARQ